MTHTRLRRAALLAALLAAGAAPGALAQQRVDQRASVPAGTRVEVDNLAGSVRVTAWDRNEVHVTGELGRGVERLEFERDGSRMRVRVVLPRQGRNTGASTLEVRVPARSPVTVRSVSGDISSTGVAGRLQVQTVSGDLRVRAAGGDVTAETQSGGVTVEGSAADVRASSVSGDVRVQGGASGRFEASSMSGDVTVSGPVTNPVISSVSGDVRVSSATGVVRVNSVSGNVQVTGERLGGTLGTVSGDVTFRGSVDRREPLEINAHSGDVRLFFSRGTGAVVDFTSASGDLHADIPVRAERRSRRETRVTVGSGGGEVRVNTFSGDVRIGS